MGNKQSKKYKDISNISEFSKINENGTKYIGFLKENQKHGQGTMDFENGDIYEGDWEWILFQRNFFIR